MTTPGPYVESLRHSFASTAVQTIERVGLFLETEADIEAWIADQREVLWASNVPSDQAVARRHIAHWEEVLRLRRAACVVLSVEELHRRGFVADPPSPAPSSCALLALQLLKPLT